MHPELIPGFPLKTYGVCMALGFLAAWQVLAFICRRTGRDGAKLSDLLVALMISGVIGSRIAYVIEHWRSEFAGDWLSVLYVWRGGLMFYGGFILAAVVFVLWCRVKGERKLALADMLSVALPLGHAFGRVGCFFYGCCYGRMSSSSLAVSFPYRSPAWHEQLASGVITASARSALPVLPTQLFEALALALLFAVLLAVYLRLHASCAGFTSGLYLVGYAIIRYGIEFLRGDPRAEVGPFSISQAISLALFITGISLIGIAICRKKV